MAQTTLMRGGCHCGRIALEFRTTMQPGDFSPRACDCSFCRKHGAIYISDRNGRLVVDIKPADSMGEYRFGHELAKFLFCRNCGVYVAVLFEAGGRILGSVNARCLSEGTHFGDPQVVSPQKLDAAQKKERWASVMIPDVQLRLG